MSDDEAIHQARKSVKKIRSIVRLLRDDLGSDYRVLNRQLRTAAHDLSTIRDADAAIETIRSLHDRYPGVVTPSVRSAALKGLRGRKRETVRRGRSRVGRAVAALRGSEKTALSGIRRVARFPAVRDGLARSYQRARKAMEPLGPAADATQFHAWRRRVKDHSYHVRLFEGLNATPRQRAKRLRRLEEWLGEDHDQALLRGVILARPSRFGDSRETAVVLGCITKYQAWERGRALRLGKRLFATPPGEFRKSVTRWWRASDAHGHKRR